jgi:hypothetical protein
MGVSADKTDSVDRIKGLLRDVVLAADRMRDRWAEGDEAVKRELWTNLHTAAEAAYDDVYPLLEAEADYITSIGSGMQPTNENWRGVDTSKPDDHGIVRRLP